MQLIGVVSLIAFISGCQAEDTVSYGREDGETIKLFHSIGQPENWSQRGSIQVSRSGDLISKQENPLSDQEFIDLKRASSAGGLYYVKAVSGRDAKVATTFTTACSLYTSSLSDIVDITLDSNGNFLGVAVASTNPHCLSGLSGPRSSFNTTYNIRQTNLAPGPDTQTYIHRLDQEKAEKLRGDKGDNRSFLARYWMYIVPVVIFLMVSSAANPEGQGGR
ncbi:ER membrane protein complex subunit 10 [Halotydeus destructor]|nr:ER membrane protein complex subunit 10 [Halotydeus destructor]